MRARPAPARRRRRANRVDELAAAGVALVAGVVASTAGAAPTGSPPVDHVLVAAAVGLVVYAGASAPWSATMIAAAAALVVAGGQPVLTALALWAMATAYVVGLRRRNMPLARAAAVGLSCNVLVRGDLRWSFGLSALVGVALGAFVIVAGLRRRPRQVRRRAWWAIAGIAATAVVAIIAFGIAALGVRRDLEAGQRGVDAGVDALGAGDIAGASEHFAAAGAALRDAHQRLAGPIGVGASAIPVLAQHRDVLSDATAAGATATTRVASALDDVDLDALGVTGGTIDVAAVSALAGPFAEVDEALTQFARSLEADRSPWLVNGVGEQFDSVRDRVGASAARIATARRAIAFAPGMLGADGPRRYLVLFTTPAEARGLGGFIGNYAELTFDGGHGSLTAFGRVSDLERQATGIGARLSGPSGFLERYGMFGFDLDGAGLVGDAAFRNVTMAAHFPWVGEVAADLYGQITGTRPDGVVAMDPYTLATLLGYTDGVDVPSLGVTLHADVAADFLLRDQYVVLSDRADRVDALEAVARATFDALLTTSLPNPMDMADDLRPLVDGRRLVMWTADGAELDLVRELGLSGELPMLNGADGWAFTLTNGGGNKIDAFLARAAGYTARTDPTTGTTTGELRIELTNGAPSDGLPDYVIGNRVGLPNGTSRLLVSLYSPLAATSITVDGEPVIISASRELEWNVFSLVVDIPPGATSVIVVELSGQLARPHDVVTWTQPLSSPVEPLS